MVVTAAFLVVNAISDGVTWVPQMSMLLVYLVLYHLLVRPAMNSHELPGGGRWRVTAWLATVAWLGILCSFDGAAALMQMIIYPIVWQLSISRRQAYWRNAGVGLAVIAGAAHAGGYTPAAFGVALISGGVAVVFSLAIGTWITSVTLYGIERQELVEELMRAQSTLERVSAEAGAVAERERLAREVHDTITQTLTALVMAAEQGQRQLASDRGIEASRSFELAIDLGRDALAEARALVAANASLPKGESLGATVERVVGRFRRDSGVRLELTQQSVVADREMEVVIVRCLQELLSNVARHADAEQVSVDLLLEEVADYPDQQQVVLRVKDDGRGFDPAASSEGLGLGGLCDRVDLRGGDVRIQSRCSVQEYRGKPISQGGLPTETSQYGVALADPAGAEAAQVDVMADARANTGTTVTITLPQQRIQHDDTEGQNGGS